MNVEQSQSQTQTQVVSSQSLDSSFQHESSSQTGSQSIVDPMSKICDKIVISPEHDIDPDDNCDIYMLRTKIFGTEYTFYNFAESVDSCIFRLLIDFAELSGKCYQVAEFYSHLKSATVSRC